MNVYTFIQKYFKYLLLGLLIYMPIFGHLSTFPIRIWDEARLAINAYEMFKNNDFIVTHFGGSPDMWNTKPPLLIWCQVFWMKVIGVNELAVRLPSALAAFLTCITLLVFSIKYLKDFWFGFIATIVLVTSFGYVGFHATRTGDYDSLLTLFTTLSTLSFFAYCETDKIKQLYFFFMLTALAVLTKSVAGLFFLPAILIYSIYRGKFISLIKNKHSYIGLLSFIVIVISYFLARDFKNPGYITAVHENDLGGRFLEVLDNHRHSFWFYYNNFIDHQLSAWYLLIPCGIILGLFSKNIKINRITVFSTLMVTTVFLVISKSQTKLPWYDVPLYPFLAILTAISIHFVFGYLKDSEWAKEKLKYNVSPFVFLFLIFITPYKDIINKTYLPKENAKDAIFYEIGYYLQSAVKSEFSLDGQYLLYEKYNAQNMFYLNILRDRGEDVWFQNLDKLKEGDIAFAVEDNVKKYVRDHYDYELITVNGRIETYRINGTK